MPIYVYECGAGHRFEELQGFNDAPLDVCECGAKASRVISRVGLLVTQNGFEENDRKAKNKDALHQARLDNKRSIEDNWWKVEQGLATYSHGKNAEAYRPRQDAEIRKKHF